MTPFRRLSTVALSASAVACAFVGSAAIAAPFPAAPASNAPTAPPPVAIATVDIIRLVDKLNEKSDWDVQLAALTKKIQTELDSRKASIETQIKAIDSAPEAQKSALRDRVALEDLQLREWANYKRAEIDRERALMWQSIYRNIRIESAKLAEAEGYDLIIVNDGVTDLQIQRDANVPMEQQAQEQIMRRRMLYANRNIDVTDKLLLRMNNARSASGANSSPAAGGTPPAGGAASPGTP
ncbi:MAG: OmpH family outer membrane protein [Phycisphaerae bacterium]|nr:OmpH family outer membrane protein [Phycisphaerae bacterium]